MAKFDAGLSVESLDYDFTAFGGKEGTIQEPSTAKVNTFFNRMKELMREVSAMQSKFQDLEDDDLDGEALADKIGQVEEATAGAEEYQSKSIQYLAELCGNSPSVEELEMLPYRVLTAFTQWLVGEIRPKKDTPVGKR